MLRTLGYAGPNDPTNADSTPDYDEWGPDAHWEAKDWETWHAAMVSKYGKSVADDHFVEAYGKAGILESITRARIEDQQFINWAQNAGLYDKLVSAEEGVRSYEAELYQSGLLKYLPIAGGVVAAFLLYKLLKK